MGSDEYGTSENVMRFEERRLSTFQNWPPNAKVDARKIAKAGFYHTGAGTKVKCSWCGCQIDNWNYGDQVMARHRSESPDCPFIRNQSNNVPIYNNNSSVNNNSSNNGSINHYEDEPVQDGNNDISENDTADSEQFDNDSEDFIDDPGADNASPDDDNVLLVPSVTLDFVESDPGDGFLESPASQAALKKEAVRLNTFSNWPLPFIRPNDLAKSGFIYTGRSDCVRCVFCGEYVGEWDVDDDPSVEHRNLFPHCPFVRGEDVGNVGIDQSVGDEEVTSATASAASGSDEVGIRPGTMDSGSAKSPSVLRWTNNAAGSSKDSEGTGIIRHSGPAHPKYSTVEARMRTFRDWPPALRQQPGQLTEAGFYYIGLSDQVKCFYCDGGLRNWQPEDDPWTEHSRWFSKCGFVRLVKGDKFIKHCLEQRPTDESASPAFAAGGSHGESVSKDATLASARIRVEDVPSLMSSSLVRQALDMGIDASRIKMALMRRASGRAGGGGPMYRSVHELMSDAVSEQREQEDRVCVENNDTPTAFVGGVPNPEQGVDVAGAWTERRSQTYNSGAEECPSTVAGSTSQESQEDTEEEAMVTTSTESNQHSDVAPSSEKSSLQPSSSAPAPCSAAHALSEQLVQSSVSEEPVAKSERDAVKADGRDLEQENRRLKEQRTCKICMDSEIGVVFLPCGHLICCVQCAPALKDCPLCRQPIHGTVKTYMS